MPSEQSSKWAWELWIVVIKGLLQSAALSGKWSLVNLKHAVENRFGFTQLVNACLTAWFCRRKGRDLFQHCTTSLLLVEKSLHLTGVVRCCQSCQRDKLQVQQTVSGDVAWLPCSVTEPLWRLRQIAKSAQWLTCSQALPEMSPKRKPGWKPLRYSFSLITCFSPT